MRRTKENIFVIAAAFICMVLVFAARHHPPSRRKIKEIWHGRVYWESNTTMLRSAPEKALENVEPTELSKPSTNLGSVEPSTKLDALTPKIQVLENKICQPHVVFTTFKCPKCDSLRQKIEDNTLHTWSKMNRVTFEVISNAKTNEHGVPILGDMYTKMFQKCPDAQTYTYVNGDIIGTSDFVETIEAVQPIGDFLMVGKRTNVPWSENHDAKHANFNFDAHFKRGALFRPDAQDYFTVTKNAIDWKTIPAFVVGRPGYDNWLVDHIYHNSKVALIDATKTISVIHQTDAEGNVAQGGKMVKSSSDREYNRLIGKGQWDHGRTGHAEWETGRFDGKIVLKNRKSGKVFEAKNNKLVEFDRLTKQEKTSQYNSILRECGALCDIAVKQIKGKFFNKRSVVSDCDSLFSETLFSSKGHGQEKAPKKIPSDMVQGYTLNGAIPTKNWYFNQVYHGGTAKESVWSFEMVEAQKKQCSDGKLKGSYSVSETNALLDGLRHAPNLKGGRVLVIGSERPWVEACALAAGAKSVVTLEYGKITSQHPDVSTFTPEEFKKQYFAETLGTFDSIVTFSSVEHAGLGRYGDALNPWADVLEIARARCVTRTGGSLVIGVMYGNDELVWNAHRIYGPKRWPYLTTNWNHHYLGRGSQKIHVFVNTLQSTAQKPPTMTVDTLATQPNVECLRKSPFIFNPLIKIPSFDWELMSLVQSVRKDGPSGIPMRCDWVIGTRWQHWRRAPIENVYGDMTKSPRSIFVQTEQLQNFHDTILPCLHQSERFVLILGDHDLTTPIQTDKRYRVQSNWPTPHKFKYSTWQSWIADPRIVHIFVEHLDEIQSSPKVSPIPLGMNPAEDNAIMHMTTSQIKYKFNKRPIRERPLIVRYTNRVRSGSDQWKDRKTALNNCNGPWKSFCKSGAIQNKFHQELGNFPFVFCVHGGGIDPNPTLWSTLLAGSIPIIVKFPGDTMYNDFPVVKIDNLDSDSITVAKLEAWRNTFAPYFEGNRRQNILNKLTADFWWAKIEDKLKTTIENKNAVTKPASKYLRYRCSSGCGGWSDRWKGAVLTYILAKRSNRIFRMQWDTLPLTTVFEPNDIFKPVSQSCSTLSWIDQQHPSLTLPEADCIELKANVIPKDFESEYPVAARELWNKLTLRKELLVQVALSPDNMRCAQIRNGKSKTFPDCPNCYGFKGDDKKAQKYEKDVFEWLGSGKNTHLWTDSSEQEQRWRSYNPSAFFVDGSIVHLDKNPTIEGLKRTVIQWALIAKCQHIAPFSGYIRAGLFLAPEANVEPSYGGKLAKAGIEDKLKTTETNNIAVEVDNWTVVVTVSIGFDDMFSNWFAFYSKLNLDMNVILIAEDEQIYKKYTNVDGIDVWKSQYPDSNDPIALSYDTPQYKKLVSRRAAHLLRVLKVQKRIIYTDIDTVWLSDPRPFFKGDFDLFAQLDGNKYYCTGFMALQRTKNTLSLLEEWNRRLLTNPQLNQPIFNKIIKSITIKHKELPRQEFPSGDLYFGQNKQQNVVIVHNNYIVGKDNKIQRFKEVGLWSINTPQKKREKYCLDFKHTSMVYQDVVWQTPKQLCVINIQKATILKSGLLFNATSAYTFGKWYWKKHTSEISTSSSFLKQSFVSFVQIWQNSMQHITFDTYPKSRLLCPYLQQNPEIGILVMNNLQRDLIIESCFLPIKRFKIIDKAISATSIAATVWPGEFKLGIVPSNSFTSLGSQTKQGDKIIYIPRKAGTKRSVINEKEVLDLLRRYFGNKLHIYNPKNDWRVDRKVFEQASVIIGPHGGGMSNMVFAPVNTTIIEFLPLTSLRSKGENERPCYFGLARGLGFDYHSVEPLDFNFQQPMTVPLHELEKKLASIYPIDGKNVFHLGISPWSPARLRTKFNDFEQHYAFKNNNGGMRLPHQYAIFSILNELKPTTIVESGVWKGVTTQLIRKVLPHADIISIDPVCGFKKLTQHTTFCGKNFQDLKDLGLVWKDLDMSSTLLILDDHQSGFDRLKLARHFGFIHVITEDNHPFGTGDNYSLKQLWMEPENDLVIVKNNFGKERKTISKAKHLENRKNVLEWLETYVEFPPLNRKKTIDWFREYDFPDNPYKSKPRSDVDAMMPAGLGIPCLVADKLIYHFIAYCKLKVTNTNGIDRKRVTKPPEGTQMGPEQIQEILSVLPKNGNLLVWGLGNDSPFWHDSTDGKVVFIEDDIPEKKAGTLWFDMITAKYPFLEAYTVHYTTDTVKSYDKYMRRTELWDIDLDIRAQLPNSVTNTRWDVILVDAPLGCCNVGPGRYQSIYTSKLLSNSDTHVFVDDYERKVEKQFSLKVFDKQPVKIVKRQKAASNANDQAHFVHVSNPKTYHCLPIDTTGDHKKMVIPSDKRQCLIESSMSERVSQLCDSVLGEPMATASHKLMFGDIHLHKNEYTMVGVQRLKNFAASIAEVNREKIPGAIVELGVWRGGGMMVASAINIEAIEQRELYLFDAFENIPGYGSNVKYLQVEESFVKDGFLKFGVMNEHVHFRKGLFQETVPSWDKNDKVAVLRVDGNFYDSYQDAMYYMYESVPVGGIIIFDDVMSHTSVMRFWKDFKKEQGLEEDLNRIDKHSAWFRKVKDVVLDWKYFRAPQDVNKKTPCPMYIRECHPSWPKRPTKTYHSSKWEQLWLDNIEQWQDHKICEALTKQTEQIRAFMKDTCSASTDTDWCLIDDSVHQVWYNTKNGQSVTQKPSSVTMVTPLKKMTPKDDSIWSYFELSDGTREYIEPLVSHLRHPLARCMFGGTFLVDRSYVLPGNPGSSKTFLFDAGASHWSQGAGGPSLSYFTSVWKRYGFDWSHIEGWEGGTTVAKFEATVPQEWRSKTHFHQDWISTSPDKQPFVPDVIRSTVSKEDYVVFKLDIDSKSVETAVVDYLLTHPEALEYIDEVVWEQHVNNYLMAGNWGHTQDMSKTIADSYTYFLKLRKLGVRAHSWV